MTDDQIKHMVDRFLSWPLPKNFNPDAGITFEPDFNQHTDHPMRHEPVGTNLLDAQQAEAMVRHMVAGMVAAPSVTMIAQLRPVGCPRGASCCGNILTFSNGVQSNSCGLIGCLHNYNETLGGCGTDQVMGV